MDEMDRKPPQWMIESLERSEAQIDAGQTLPLEPMLEKMRETIARMKAARETAEAKKAKDA